jgi:CheY-like chemotaxis protein
VTRRRSAAPDHLEASGNGAGASDAPGGSASNGAPPGSNEATPTQSGRAAREPVVLIAEDNEVNCTLAQALLHKRGVQTAIAHNGREAVAMAAARAYAAILMDCQMPDVDGYEATRQIRAAEHGRHVPIVAMTAHSMPGDRERCLAAGMDDYLPKPLRISQLDVVIERWLGAVAAS